MGTSGKQTECEIYSVTAADKMQIKNNAVHAYIVHSKLAPPSCMREGI